MSALFLERVHYSPKIFNQCVLMQKVLIKEKKIQEGRDIVQRATEGSSGLNLGHNF